MKIIHNIKLGNNTNITLEISSKNMRASEKCLKISLSGRIGKVVALHAEVERSIPG